MASAFGFSAARQSIGRRGLPAIAGGAGRLKAKSFRLDGEAVVVGPNGLTDFEALRRRGSGDVAVLYAFDLLEYDGSDLRACRSKPGSQNSAAQFEVSLAGSEEGRLFLRRDHHGAALEPDLGRCASSIHYMFS
jgi:hypothetical protein